MKIPVHCVRIQIIGVNWQTFHLETDEDFQGDSGYYIQHWNAQTGEKRHGFPAGLNSDALQVRNMPALSHHRFWACRSQHAERDMLTRLLIRRAFPELGTIVPCKERNNEISTYENRHNPIITDKERTIEVPQWMVIP